MSILQSIKPQYCELIASGKKTIEVRKTRPKLETPFKVYIYMTKSNLVGDRKAYKDRMAGKVIGEYVCDEIEAFSPSRSPYETDLTITKASCLSIVDLIKYSNMDKPLYAWHISDLKIYDKPKELSEFMIIDKDKLSRCPYRERIFQNPEFTNGNYLYGGYSCSKAKEPDFDDIDFCRGGCADVFKPLTRPPQSWCYVEKVKE